MAQRTDEDASRDWELNRRLERSWEQEPRVTARTAWRYQLESGVVVAGFAADARGLQLRAQCGYTHVDMGAGLVPIEIAIGDLSLIAHGEVVL